MLSPFLTAALFLSVLSGLAAPIQLHPDNPHYFLFRGKPTILITAGEHYGAVMNLDFDYLRYLDELKAHRFNLTRTFSGTYRELSGTFNIAGNTLAPAPGRFVCPWRSDSNGKFDLTKYDPSYFSRLKDFVAQASQRGIVVELVLFCTMYDDSLWNASPMNSRNNVNSLGNIARTDVYTAKNKELLAAQQAVTRKLVRELNEFDNIYFEICNEPYERGGLTKEWNDHIIAAMVDAEAGLPNKHLIAQNFASSPVRDLNPKVSILNFHAATPESVRLNYGLNKPIAFDETGGSDRSDRKYRTEGWNFIIAGGAVYDHLDFSFTTDREDGSAVPLPSGTPGGGGPELRRQLRILKDFTEAFDFTRMKPNDALLKEKTVTGAGEHKPTARVLAEPGKAYAIYVTGGTRANLTLEVPAGAYKAEWLNPKTGAIDKTETFTHPGGDKILSSPIYSEDIALRIRQKPESQ